MNDEEQKHGPQGPDPSTGDDGQLDAFAAKGQAAQAAVDDITSRLQGRVHPHLTEAELRAKIAEVNYLRHHTLTICVITMANGFHLVGKAAPAHPGNFDPVVGEKDAFEDAFRQLWPLEGYLLREWLAQGGHRAGDNPVVGEAA